MANYYDSQGLPVSRADLFYQDAQGNMVPVSQGNPLPVTAGSGGPGGSVSTPSYTTQVDSSGNSPTVTLAGTTGLLNIATGLPPITSLPASTSAAGAGTVLDGGAAHTNHCMVVTTGSVASTAGTVILEGSHDNTNWVQLGTFSPTAANTSTAVSATGAYRYIRSRVTVALSGGTIQTTVAMS